MIEFNGVEATVLISDANGRGLLHHACRNGNLNVVRVLLNYLAQFPRRNLKDR